MQVLAVDGCLGDGHGIAGVGYPLATREDLARLEGYAGRVVTAVTDVRDAGAVREATLRAVDTWGRLDVAVAAAAVIAGGRYLWETPEADLETLWRTDVVGVWHTAAAVVPPMLAGPDPSGCRFVAVASSAASRGLFQLAAYGTVKHAVLGLVRGLAADLTGTGVVAVSVSPGATDTAMLRATADLYGLDDVAPLAAGQPGDRLHQPEEVAATVLRCCSAEGVAWHGLDIGVGAEPA